MLSFNDQIIYQIFPERFNIGGGKNIRDKLESGVYEENALPKQWKELPAPGAQCPYEMFGGDIQGVIEKLDYIHSLGVTAVYLTPLFPSPSNHKYDAYDFKRIDPAFGTRDDFDRLLEALHLRGMFCIIDLAINHLSSRHPWFLDAVSNPSSPYRDFFSFSDYPEVYDCWRGFRTMPELNYASDAVRHEFITGEESVIRYWARTGVDGIRLDCANDLGIEINRLITESAKMENENITVIGEVINFAPEFSDSMDSLQTYFFTSSIKNYLTGYISSTQFGRNVDYAVSLFPHEKLIQNINILSSHDSPRILTDLHENADLVKLAIVMQFTLPGVPKIYYGDETGMLGGDDPENRAPMIWDEHMWNTEIYDTYRRMVDLRRDCAELRSGKIMDLSQWLDNGVVAYLRYDADDPRNYSIIIINPRTEEKTFRLFVPYSYMFSDMKHVDILHYRESMSYMSTIDITVGPMEAGIYRSDYLGIENYNYFKRVSPLEIK